jgi:AcrR family transcriptional regulator
VKTADAPKFGRPRNEGAHRAILQAALDLVSAEGYRAITVDQIAARAQVGKMTIYRRWPNKAAVVMDSLLEIVGPETDFPSTPCALESMKKQLHLQVKFFRSKYGRLIRSLLAEAQSNDELAEAFRERWIVPRRRGVVEVLQRAIDEGKLRGGIDLELTTDLLYGPLYYRLLIGTGTITTAFADALYEQFMTGHQPETSRPSKFVATKTR